MTSLALYQVFWSDMRLILCTKPKLGSVLHCSSPERRRQAYLAVLRLAVALCLQLFLGIWSPTFLGLEERRSSVHFYYYLLSIALLAAVCSWSMNISMIYHGAIQPAVASQMWSGRKAVEIILPNENAVKCKLHQLINE